MRALSVAALLLAGCANNVGPEGPAVGGRCMDEFDCAAGSFCLFPPQFPDGTCTRNCESAGHCPGGSTCAALSGGVCLLRCTSAMECRSGYSCLERTRAEGGTATVCIAP